MALHSLFIVKYSNIFLDWIWRLCDYCIGGSAQGLLSGGPESITSFFIVLTRRVGIRHIDNPVRLECLAITNPVSFKLQTIQPRSEFIRNFQP